MGHPAHDQDAQPSSKARSTSLDLADAQFTLDLGATRSLRALAITHTNATEDALCRITWYSDVLTTAIDNSGWFSPQGYVEDDDVDMLGAAFWHILSTATNVRSLKYEFDDQANPAGFLEIGRNFVPDCWQPPLNMDVGAVEDLLPNTEGEDALGGSTFYTRRTPKRALQFGFGFFDQSVAPAIRRIRRIANLNKQVIIIPDPEDEANFVERNFVGTLRAMPKITLLQAGLVAGNGFEVLEAV